MFKFFRNIRRRLLRENRFTKYLFYAIGEIILVVIGILIALQINNWNEDRKNKTVEQALMKDLVIDLKNDIYWLELTIEKNQIKTERLDSLLIYAQEVNELSNQDILYELSILSLYNINIFQNQNRTIAKFPNMQYSIIHTQVADSLAAFIASLENVQKQTEVYENTFWSALDLQKKIFHNYLFFDPRYFKDGKKTGKQFPRLNPDINLQREYFNNVHLYSGVIKNYISNDYLKGHLERTERLISFLEDTYSFKND